MLQVTANLAPVILFGTKSIFEINTKSLKHRKIKFHNKNLLWLLVYFFPFPFRGIYILYTTFRRKRAKHKKKGGFTKLISNGTEECLIKEMEMYRN